MTCWTGHGAVFGTLAMACADVIAVVPDSESSCRREVLKTPFRHEAHSDVQGRIQEAFETGCEFRETAACLSASQDLMTLQLLFLPVHAFPCPCWADRESLSSQRSSWQRFTWLTLPTLKQAHLTGQSKCVQA